MVTIMIFIIQVNCMGTSGITKSHKVTQQITYLTRLVYMQLSIITHTPCFRFETRHLQHLAQATIRSKTWLYPAYRGQYEYFPESDVT